VLFLTIGKLELFMTILTSGSSDPALNLVRPRSWCWKIHFETKTVAEMWRLFIWQI